MPPSIFTFSSLPCGRHTGSETLSPVPGPPHSGAKAPRAQECCSLLPTLPTLQEGDPGHWRGQGGISRMATTHNHHVTSLHQLRCLPVPTPRDLSPLRTQTLTSGGAPSLPSCLGTWRALSSSVCLVHIGVLPLGEATCPTCQTPLTMAVGFGDRSSVSSASLPLCALRRCRSARRCSSALAAQPFKKPEQPRQRAESRSQPPREPKSKSASVSVSFSQGRLRSAWQEKTNSNDRTLRKGVQSLSSCQPGTRQHPRLQRYVFRNPRHAQCLTSFSRCTNSIIIPRANNWQLSLSIYQFAKLGTLEIIAGVNSEIAKHSDSPTKPEITTIGL